MALNANDMGQRMDDALNALMIAAGKPGLPTGPADQVEDRERLFRAIAEGVIAHLRANPEAFVLEVNGATGFTVKMKQIL
jgi:hypothetical protein